MLVPILQYPDRVTSGRDVYRVSAVGERQDDGRWSGYLVFTSIIGGRSVMTPRETTQSSFETLDHWARGISPVYLEGAIERALSLQPEARLERQLADIERLEVDATLEAEELERAAAIARAEAELAAEKRVETQRALAEARTETAAAEADEPLAAAAEAEAAAARARVAAARASTAPGRRRE
jgi:hypothetical protein